MKVFDLVTNEWTTLSTHLDLLELITDSFANLGYSDNRLFFQDGIHTYVGCSPNPALLFDIKIQ